MHRIADLPCERECKTIGMQLPLQKKLQPQPKGNKMHTMQAVLSRQLQYFFPPMIWVGGWWFGFLNLRDVFQGCRAPKSNSSVQDVMNFPPRKYACPYIQTFCFLTLLSIQSLKRIIHALTSKRTCLAGLQGDAGIEGGEISIYKPHYWGKGHKDQSLESKSFTNCPLLMVWGQNPPRCSAGMNGSCSMKLRSEKFTVYCA